MEDGLWCVMFKTISSPLSRWMTLIYVKFGASMSCNRRGVEFQIHVWWFSLPRTSEILDCCWILSFLNSLFCYYFNSCLTCVVCLCVDARVPAIDNQTTQKKNREDHTRDLHNSTKCLRPWSKRIHSLCYSTTLDLGLQIISYL